MASKTSDHDAAAHVAGRDVAGRLHAAETTLDVAMTEARLLIDLLPNEPAEAKTAASASIRALGRGLGRASLRLGRVHAALADIARRIGLEEATVGPLDKPEDTPPIGGGPRRRRPA